VWVLEVKHPDNGGQVDRAVQDALAQNPRGIVCNIAAGYDPDHRLLDQIAALGRHVQHWPAVPIAIACPDEINRSRLRSSVDGRDLIIAPSVLQASTEISTAPAPADATLRLPPRPTAGRAARGFLTRTLLDWRSNTAIETGCLIISELVTNAVRHSATDIEVAIGKHERLLRIAVHDHTRSLPQTLHPVPTRTGGRGIAVVEALSRSFGVLTTANPGKVVWAVLDI
jgi:anti-sigma regulatory factor (Ser/Thr protein kinase)